MGFFDLSLNLMFVFLRPHITLDQPFRRIFFYILHFLHCLRKLKVYQGPFLIVRYYGLIAFLLFSIPITTKIHYLISYLHFIRTYLLNETLRKCYHNYINFVKFICMKSWLDPHDIVTLLIANSNVVKSGNGADLYTKIAFFVLNE